MTTVFPAEQAAIDQYVESMSKADKLQSSARLQIVGASAVFLSLVSEARGGDINAGHADILQSHLQQRYFGSEDSQRQRTTKIVRSLILLLPNYSRAIFQHIIRVPGGTLVIRHIMAGKLLKESFGYTVTTLESSERLLKKIVSGTLRNI